MNKRLFGFVFVFTVLISAIFGVNTLNASAAAKQKLNIDVSEYNCEYDSNGHQGYSGISVESNKVPVSELNISYFNEDMTPCSSLPRNAGIYNVTVSIPESNALYTGSTEFQFAITKKQLSQSGTTAKDKQYDGTNIALVNPGELIGVCEGDDVSLSVKSAKYRDTSVGEGKDVTVVFELSGNDAKNYVVPEEISISAAIKAVSKTLSPIDKGKNEHEEIKSPETSDNSFIFLYIALLSISALLIFCLTVVKVR